MQPANGIILRYITAIALLIMMLPPGEIKGQGSILDSTYNFRAGTVKTINALNLITRATGYHFTYDTRLIDPDRKTEMTFRDTRLKVVLDSILKNDSLVYSVIDKFIIISKELPLPSHQSDTLKAQPIGNISGVIVDAESSEPLQYATVSLKHEGKGTISNGSGEFILKISPSGYADTMQVSYLGYYSRSIPVRQALGSNFSIAMTREFISIPEIIIKNQIPQEIIYKAVAAIPKNYGNTPANMTAFYREGVLRKTKLQTYSEAILEIYKSSYTPTLYNDQIKVFKSRKIENISTSDTVTVRLKGGLSTCLELDGVRNLFDFLSAGSMVDYSYKVTDIVSFGDESAYKIEFSSKEGAEQAMFHGSVFINTCDFAILEADFEIYPSYLQKMKELFIASTLRGFITWPEAVRYSVSYRKVNDRYFLSHVRGDLDFLSRQRKKLFNAQFKVFFEMAVTDITTTNVKRFEREELAPIHSVFSKTITHYDPTFWEDQDFLKPEDNLLQALKNMKVKLQLFTE